MDEDAKPATGGVARGAAVSLIGQWSQYVIQIGSVVVYSRLLSPAEIGLVAAATAFTAVAWTLSDFGLSLAGLQAESLSQPQKSMLFWANSALGVVLALTVAACAPLIALFYDDQRLVPIVVTGSLCFLLYGLTAQFEVAITRAGRFATLSAIGVLSQVAGLASGVLVIVLGGSYWGLVVAPVVVVAVRLVGAAAKAGWWPGRPRRGVPMRHLYTFGGTTVGLQVVTYVTTNADSVAIGRVLGNAQLGLYNRAYQLSQVPALQLASPLTKVFLPALSRQRGDQVAYQRLVGRIQVFLGYVLVGGLSLLAVEAPAVIRLAFGDGWDGAAPVLQVLCIAAMLELLGQPYYWSMLAWARTGLLFWVELGPRILTIALIVVLVPHGIVAVAWALVAGQVAALVLGAVFVLPAARLARGPFVASILRPAVSVAVAAGLTALVLDRVPELPAIVDLLLGTAVWLAAAAALTLVPAIRRDVDEIVGAARALRGRRQRVAADAG